MSGVYLKTSYVDNSIVNNSIVLPLLGNAKCAKMWSGDLTPLLIGTIHHFVPTLKLLVATQVPRIAEPCRCATSSET